MAFGKKTRKEMVVPEPVEAPQVDMVVEAAKPPSIGAFIAKVAFGVLFIVAGLFPPKDTESDPVMYTATAVVIGVALIAWGIATYLAKKKAYEAHLEEVSKKKEEARRAEVERVRICKVCGARTSGTQCEYCDAPLDL